MADIPAIVTILSAYREKLARWSPQFWQPATGAATMSTFFLGTQVEKDGTIFLVAEVHNEVAGFALAYDTPAPPVYAPGKTGTLDDFGVADDARWDDIGRTLLAAIRQKAEESGWEQLIVVSPAADDLKNAVLVKAGLAVASQWWTTRL
ncbi:GNAT family N-acetyltransferase [Parerythrobacter aurantius]|uniref:GNAT family N-acetyltransferase n=1 Tax=Parerythrobacter aurantius TaxID=3127706 RepID=UPI0032439DD8